MRLILLKLTFFIIVLATSTVAANTAVPMRAALVIGNSSYGGGYDLDNPINDANAMASTLRDLGFEVTSHLDLDLRGMKQAVTEFSKSLENSDKVGLFYYAGHAVEVEGINYLLPVSFEINSAVDLEYEAYEVQRMIDTMQSSRDGLNIVMIDACRDNPFRGFRSVGKTRGVAEISAPLGTFISSSTASGDYAVDGSGGNSPYTAAVLKHIREPGITIEQVFKKVRVDVLSATGNRQVPWESSSIVDDFYFSGVEDQQELEQIAKNELAQSQIRQQAQHDKEQAEQIAELLKSLEVQKLQLEEANRERNRLASLVGSDVQNATEPSTDFEQQQTIVDREVARLREEEKILAERQQAQHDDLLNICDSMAEKYSTSIKTVECYKDFLEQENPNSSRAIIGLSDLKDRVLNSLNFALADKKLSTVRKNMVVLEELSPSLVPSFQDRVEILEEEILEDKNETKAKVKSVVTF